MSNYLLLSLLSSATLLLLLLILGILFIQNKYFRSFLGRLNKTEANLKEEIQASVQTKFLEASLEAKDLMDLAVEVWRIDQKLSKAVGKLGENQSKSLENSMNKIKKFIERYDLEVRDYTGQKYNSGLSAIDVLSVEKDSSISEDTVKETVEPAILLKGQIVKKAKVILLSKN